VAYVHHDGEEPSGKGGFRPSARQIAAGVLIGLVLLFALVNLEKVSVDFVITSVEIPLFFVFVGSGLLGIAAGALIRHHQREHRDD
jgi:uncharacterized integral membrane protein